MKKLVSLFLALLLSCSLAVPALALSDVTWTKDTTLSVMRNQYNNATVKSGVKVTLHDWRPDPQGLEIGKSLTVEAGGTLTGGCLVFSRGATCSGLALYYIVGGQETLLTATLAELCAVFPQSDYQPTFWYESATGHYVLHGNTFEGDPFAPPPPADGGTSGSPDPALTDVETQRYAEALKALGLFLGTDRGFELDRQPTRTEELVMLLRLLGNKDETLRAYPAERCPFDDVDGWARGSVAFAYDKGLTNGVGGGKFNMATPPTQRQLAQMFCTFVLRAMGYNDDPAKGPTDFTYNGALDFADANGLLRGGANGDDANRFNRGVCVRIMESALRQSTKDGQRLWQKLAAEGVFTEAQYLAAMPQ